MNMDGFDSFLMKNDICFTLNRIHIIFNQLFVELFIISNHSKTNSTNVIFIHLSMNDLVVQEEDG